MRCVPPAKHFLIALMVSSTLSATWGTNAGAQTVERGRCSKEVADIVATIDALMFQAKPSIRGYTKLLREKLPNGPCDVDAIRTIVKQSPHFHWHKVLKSGEMFRLSSKYLVSDFWIDLNTREIPSKGINVRVKKDEVDFL
ncbi:hypothetical protein SAMN02927900_05925 [Rhizobium mongolense subsp. loessense]|uniref:Uncharacterized protein n=1 Tax=Rhizobium mongolense subsp. loessense TaxID=158890 RepID=A0A1G4U179_9HYPH|nr:hypothetical protein SAMN02927900_05925 [Rhizobium mongolense subsp. loessense]